MAQGSSRPGQQGWRGAAVACVFGGLGCLLTGVACVEEGAELCFEWILSELMDLES
jgi:hypothetical protein